MILSADFFDDIYVASSVLTTTRSLKSLATTSLFGALFITLTLSQSFFITHSDLILLPNSAKSLALPTSIHSKCASTTFIDSHFSRRSVSILPCGIACITVSENLTDLLIAGTFLLAVLHVVYNSDARRLAALVISPALNTSIPLFHRYPSS